MINEHSSSVYSQYVPIQIIYEVVVIAGAPDDALQELLTGWTRARLHTEAIARGTATTFTCS